MSEWRGMQTAPKDGTEILIRFRHENYNYCDTDEERERWQEDCKAHWIDFNGGGWTWHGIYGLPIAWQPLPSLSGEKGKKK